MSKPTTPPDPFVHPALFYRDQAEYLAGTTSFIRAGLAAGEPVAVAVPAAGLELLRAELGTEGRAVRFIDMEQAGRNPGRIIPRVLRAFADAHPDRPVRIIGEPVWAGRSAAEYPACAQHEALINHAFAGRRVTILCPYDTRRLSPRALVDAYATHPLIIRDGRARPSDRYAPDQVIAAYNRPPAPPPGPPARFPFDAARLPDARRFVVDRARALGLSPAALDDLALAVAELTTNSVVHGGGSGTVRVWAEDGHLVWEVADRGHHTDPLAGRRPPTPERPGGRGLLLVHYLSDLVHTHTRPGATLTRCWVRR
ncbi:anti-sigma factor RsbA family regulatory protein [Streptomyces sp. NPDC052396]|uniref:anti-sigma factor RsbA family regulatory protein n=1 Tax=Streptomyces sp. NPDC052396 TaxID=3365689 RepID=UPI0037CEFA2C